MFTAALKEAGRPEWATRLQTTQPESLIGVLTELEGRPGLPAPIWVGVVRYKAFLQGKLSEAEAKKAIWTLAGLL